ncbi:hypothetical protein SLEP1_g4526 [Rubroshorea leprosula]|uniref:Uncharacterized protein n=1 Tax=Rubroshorea leprosula TaxID=152421 RepID=A0AAV5HWP6_9ROSI|nr:hypothetical protein SLEP1_g4526 [Rubroshorea leprosula]
MQELKEGEGEDEKEDDPVKKLSFDCQISDLPKLYDSAVLIFSAGESKLSWNQPRLEEAYLDLKWKRPLNLSIRCQYSFLEQIQYANVLSVCSYLIQHEDT